MNGWCVREVKGANAKSCLGEDHLYCSLYIIMISLMQPERIRGGAAKAGGKFSWIPSSEIDALFAICGAFRGFRFHSCILRTVGIMGADGRFLWVIVGLDCIIKFDNRQMGGLREYRSLIIVD